MSAQPTHRIPRIVHPGLTMRNGAPERRLFQLIAGLLVILPALGAFLALSYFTRGDNELTRLDDAVHSRLGELSERLPALTAPCRILTALGDGKTVAIFGLSVAASLIYLGGRSRRYFREAVVWVVAALGGGVLNFALKSVIQRARPDQVLALAPADGWSFPSGHAMGSFVVFGMAAYLLIRIVPRRSVSLAAGAVLALLVLGIGFSRIYLGAHWLSDVIGSYLAGLCWLALCVTAFRMVPTGAEKAVPRESPAPSTMPSLPPVPVTIRRKRPWQRARKAEGGRLASETDTVPQVPHVLS